MPSLEFLLTTLNVVRYSAPYDFTTPFEPVFVGVPVWHFSFPFKVDEVEATLRTSSRMQRAPFGASRE